MWLWRRKRAAVLFVKDDKYLPEIYGGVETATHGLCQLLKRRSLRAAVAAVSPLATPKARVHRHLGYPVYVAPELTISLQRALADFDPDVLVLQEVGPQVWSALRGIIGDRPIVLYQHSTFPGSHLYADAEMRVRPRTVFIANSALTRDYARSFGVDCRVVPPVFGMERFEGRRRSGENVLMISVQRSKGTDIALQIAQQRPHSSFLFVESWSEEPEGTKWLVGEINRLNNASLLASVADMAPVYESARLLLMPSRCDETWGRVATEAQLFGIPVLGSCRGQLPVTIGAGGVIVDPDDELESWLNPFDRLTSDTTYFEAVSQNARVHSERLLHTVLQEAEREFLSAVVEAGDLSSCGELAGVTG